MTSVKVTGPDGKETICRSPAAAGRFANVSSSVIYGKLEAGGGEVKKRGGSGEVWKFEPSDAAPTAADSSPARARKAKIGSRLLAEIRGSPMSTARRKPSDVLVRAAAEETAPSIATALAAGLLGGLVRPGLRIEKIVVRLVLGGIPIEAEATGISVGEVKA